MVKNTGGNKTKGQARKFIQSENKKESKSPIVQSLFLPHILFEVGRSS